MPAVRVVAVVAWRCVFGCVCVCVPVQASRDTNSPSAEDHILARQTLEINPSHPVILSLNRLRDTQPAHAIMVAEQVFDNALVAAGLLDDPRVMLPRLTRMLEMLAADAPSAVEPLPPTNRMDALKPYPAEAEELAVQDHMQEAFSDEAMEKLKARPAAAATEPDSK